MDKSILFLIIVIIISLTILGVTGEYFAYRYYSLATGQQTSQTAINVASNTNSNAAINQTNSGSSENSIASFDFNDPMAAGNIDQALHTVAITVPPDTDVTKLIPTIEISSGAAISPSSGAPQDFTNPAVYTVAAQNGATQKYTVTVNVASVLKSAEKLITSFKLSGFNPEIDGAINNDAHTVYVVVPDGTDLTKITPTIEVSDGATISPESDVIEDFTNPVIYNVTDIYGGMQNYTVTVVTESNSG